MKEVVVALEDRAADPGAEATKQSEHLLVNLGIGALART